MMNGFGEIKRKWTGYIDASSKFEHLEKKAAIMILENSLSKLIESKKEEVLCTILEYNEENLLDNPKYIAWCDFAKQIRIKFNEVNKRAQKFKFLRYIRFLYCDRYRKGL